MVIVDIVNMVSSFALTRGWWGLPVMGFTGIAAGTIIAYIVGGVLDFLVVWFGTSGARLYIHRMWPHWHTIKRLLRIGIPAGIESILAWFANFGVIAVINRMDATNASSAAHMNAIRLESISFLSGDRIRDRRRDDGWYQPGPQRPGPGRTMRFSRATPPAAES